MAKPKGAASSAVTNRPAYSRVSFLYQAAALLASQKANNAPDSKTADDGKKTEPDDNLTGMSRRLLTQMRAVSRKTNMRLRPAVKHRVCKFCDTLLVEGSSCTSTVENQSRGGRKAWADVLAVTCKTCGRVRRYPISAERQSRRRYRGEAGEELRRQEQAAELAKQQKQQKQKQPKQQNQQQQQQKGQEQQKPPKQQSKQAKPEETGNQDAAG